VVCGGGTACRSKDNPKVSGRYWASPVTAFWSARQRPKDLSGDVTLETADDVTLRLSLRQAAVQVGHGAWFVLAESGDHDPPDGVVGVSVAGVVESKPVVDDAVRGGIGANPHSIAHAPSELIRSALSPAVTSSTAAVSTPTP
jgi:hypothetical protein